MIGDFKWFQRQVSMAIRNMVSRRKDLAPIFLEAGAEELLRDIMKRSQRAPTNEVKAALRDLGCDIHLEEQWTGKRTSVTNWNPFQLHLSTAFLHLHFTRYLIPLSPSMTSSHVLLASLRCFPLCQFPIKRDASITKSALPMWLNWNAIR